MYKSARHISRCGPGVTYRNRLRLWEQRRPVPTEKRGGQARTGRTDWCPDVKTGCVTFVVNAESTVQRREGGRPREGCTMEVSNTESSHQLLGVRERRVQPSSSSCRQDTPEGKNANVKGRNRNFQEKAKGRVGRRLKDGAVRIKAVCPGREAHGLQLCRIRPAGCRTRAPVR